MTNIKLHLIEVQTFICIPILAVHVQKKANVREIISIWEVQLHKKGQGCFFLVISWEKTAPCIPSKIVLLLICTNSDTFKVIPLTHSTSQSNIRADVMNCLHLHKIKDPVPSKKRLLL